MKKQLKGRVFTENSPPDQPTAAFRFRVPNDNLRHFSLRKGDVVRIKPVSSWDEVKDEEICLAQHYLGGKVSLAAITHPGPEFDYGRTKATSLITRHIGFFNSPSCSSKSAYAPIGIVIGNENEPDKIDQVACAIRILLTEEIVPEFLAESVQIAVNEIFNDLGGDRQAKLDRITDETSFPYIRKLLDLHFERVAAVPGKRSDRREVQHA